MDEEHHDESSDDDSHWALAGPRDDAPASEPEDNEPSGRTSLLSRTPGAQPVQAGCSGATSYPALGYGQTRLTSLGGAAASPPAGSSSLVSSVAPSLATTGGSRWLDALGITLLAAAALTGWNSRHFRSSRT